MYKRYDADGQETRTSVEIKSVSNTILIARLYHRVTHFSNCIWLQLRVRIFLISSLGSNRAINNNASNLRHSK